MSYEHEDGQTPGGNRNPYRAAQNTDSVRRSAAAQTGRQGGMREGTSGRGLGGEGTGRPARLSAQMAAASAIPGAGRGESAAARPPVKAGAVGAAAKRRTQLEDLKGSPRELLARAKLERARQKRRRRLIAMIAAECVALLLIFGYASFARRWSLIQREEFNPKNVQNEELSVDDIKKMKGYRMIAVFGVDSRNNDVGAGYQSDVNIICCINQDTGEIKLVSLYRDTYLNINDTNSYRKFNAAYANGGPEQALKALNKNLDLDITEYATFSWKAVADSINILGGVEVEITRPEFRYINSFITETVKATGIGSHHLTSPGSQRLDGVQAVAYGRLRLMDTDYARTERQRKIIQLAFAKAKQADYAALNNILETILPSISTNLTFADMTNLALGISKYHIGETVGFPFAKGNANMPGKGDCVIPQTLESNVSQLHTFLFGDEVYTPTERVRQISGKIAQDSGMYKEGKPFTGSALATGGDTPEETKGERAVETEPETSEAETDENGNPVIRGSDGFGEVYPGMTDENGDPIDAPIEDWPEEQLEPGISLPAGQSGYGPGSQGSSLPVQPGGTSSPIKPGGVSAPGGTIPAPAGVGSQGGTGSQAGDTPASGPGASREPGSGEPGTIPGQEGMGPRETTAQESSSVQSPSAQNSSTQSSSTQSPSPGNVRPEEISGPGVLAPPAGGGVEGPGQAGAQSGS